MEHMSKKPRRRIEKYMIEPIVYRTFTRFIICLTLALLWNRFVKSMMTTSAAYFFFAVFFVALAWMSYLRLDGLHIPKIDKKLFDRDKKPVIKYGDLPDYIDEEPDPFAGLDDDELEIITLVSNGINAVIFLVLSFF